MHSCYVLCKTPPFTSPCCMQFFQGREKREPKILANERHRGDAMLLKSLATPLLAAIVAFSTLNNAPASLAQITDAPRGATLFRNACIGCHDGGGNILQPGATLFSNDMERNGVTSEESIYNITYFGKGRMPGFGEKCSPRGQCTFGTRLQDDEIKLLAMFVKAQAEKGWPSIEVYRD